MLDPHREIQALVDSFVADLSVLAKRIAIEQVKVAFAAGTTPSPPTRAPRAPKALRPPRAPRIAAPARVTRPRRAKRDNQRDAQRGGPRGDQRDSEVLRTQLLAAIAEQPGRRTEELNTALGTTTAQIA